MKTTTTKILTFIMLSLATITTTQASSIDYNVEYAERCQTALLEQTITGSNKVSDRIVKRLDDILPTLKEKKNITDKVLYALNNKLLGMISKTAANSTKHNLYTYLLVKLDELIDNKSLYTKTYIKAECALMEHPFIETTGNVLRDQLLEKKQQLSDKEVLERYKSVDTSDWSSDGKEIFQEFLNIRAVNDPKTLNLDTVDENKFEKYDFTAHGERTLRGYMRDYNRYIASIKDVPSEFEMLNNPNERRRPWGENANLAFTRGLSLTEIAEYEQYVIAKKDLLREKTTAQGENNDSKVAEIDRKLEVFVLKQLKLIKIKWDRKEICYTSTNYGRLIKNRETFEQISVNNGQQHGELAGERGFARFYGLNLDCKLIKLYPELKMTYSELKKKSVSELNTLMKTHSYKPNSKELSSWNIKDSNGEYDLTKVYRIEGKHPATYYAKILFTPYEQAMEDYVIMIKMKEIIIKSIINEKNGKDTFEGVSMGQWRELYLSSVRSELIWKSVLGQ